MAQPALKSEFEYYVAHQAELVAKYRDKFVVIKGGQVLGAYDAELVAIADTAKTHELGTFLVKKCEPGEQSYTQTFHSRVVFA